MSIESFLSKLEKVKRRGHGKWMACCPVHQERNPSLSIKDDNGKIIMMCFGCGANGVDVAGAIGVDLSELFPPKDIYDASTNHPQSRQYFHAADILKALETETLVIYMIAKDMLTNGINQETFDRLSLAIKRVQIAKEYYD